MYRGEDITISFGAALAAVLALLVLRDILGVWGPVLSIVVGFVVYFMVRFSMYLYDNGHKYFPNKVNDEDTVDDKNI